MCNVSGALLGAGDTVEVGCDRGARSQKTQGLEQYFSRCRPLTSESACETGFRAYPRSPKADVLALRSRTLHSWISRILASEKRPLADLRVHNGIPTRACNSTIVPKSRSREEVKR